MFKSQRSLKKEQHKREIHFDQTQTQFHRNSLDLLMHLGEAGDGAGIGRWEVTCPSRLITVSAFDRRQKHVIRNVRWQVTSERRQRDVREDELIDWLKSTENEAAEEERDAGVGDGEGVGALASVGLTVGTTGVADCQSTVSKSDMPLDMISSRLHVSMNSSTDITPSLFWSIFWKTLST